ncbi:hypothetical protein VH567_11145 [Sphingomonas sp. 4RDLI-65]|uniref:hypothetical protein n=1 Tax=Sphingomonas sp. 4RDLI-65 TaxID=3111641 RepID=UPI003C20DBF4
MRPDSVRRNPKDGDDASRSSSTASDRRDGPDHVAPGAIIDMIGSRYRIVAHVRRRVLASDLRTHHPFLIQAPDGSIQLPTLRSIREMMDRGEAVPVTALGEPCATERMGVTIKMLNAADVPQGEKAIWIFLATHWTAALEARFGPHDPPWKIRKWRAALRKAAVHEATS